MKWWDVYWNAPRKVKYFYLTWLVYGLVLILTTLYCYARLDYVRSYQTKPKIETINSKS